MLEWVAFPSPGDLINPGIKPRSPTLQADSLPTELSKQTCIYSLKSRCAVLEQLNWTVISIISLISIGFSSGRNKDKLQKIMIAIAIFTVEV